METRGMKLRVRSAADPRQTLRIELPPGGSLLDLKSAVVAAISSSSSSVAGTDAQSVRLSLNRKDDLVADDPSASLRSLGLTSGDLVFFALDTAGFPSSSSAAAASQPPAELPSQMSSVVSDSSSGGCLFMKSNNDPAKRIPVGEIADCGSLPNSSAEEVGYGETLGLSRTSLQEKAGFGEIPTPRSNLQLESQSIEQQTAPQMEGEDMDVDYEVVATGKYVPLPCVLHKVLKEESENVRGSNVRLLVVSVHAVFLEYGFVGFDSSIGKVVTGVGLHHGWAAFLTTNTLKLRYTLPCLLHSDCSSVDTVDLKFQILGTYVNVYGSVAGKGLNSFNLLLNASCYAPAVGFLWENWGTSDGGRLGTSHEKQVFELWKIIKDRLSLPLHMDLCEKAGLPTPPCFMRLPTEIKIQILDHLPWMDLVKIACVCLEMKYLSSNDDMWRQRYAEAFGEVDIVGEREIRWKDKFAASWMVQKKMHGDLQQRREALRRIFPYPMPRPVPFGGAGFFIGGDYDWIPGGPLRNNRALFRPRRFSPHGNLSGSQTLF